MTATRDNTRKQNIVDNVSKRIGLPNSLIEQIVNDSIKILITNLTLNKAVKIKNFGNFFLKKKKKKIW